MSGDQWLPEVAILGRMTATEGGLMETMDTVDGEGGWVASDQGLMEQLRWSYGDPCKPEQFSTVWTPGHETPMLT